MKQPPKRSAEAVADETAADTRRRDRRAWAAAR